MKMLFIAALSVLSVNAWACPSLEGTYTCNDGQSESQTVISQHEMNGATVYNVDGEEYIADGAAHPAQDDSFNGTYTAVCSANALGLNMLGVMTFDGGVTADADINIDVTPSAQGLNMSVTGTLKSGGQTYPVEGTSSCSRN